MEDQAPFGFVTGCHAADKFMVGATLASMRHYCPDVPICLIADGDIDVSDLEREYGLIVLRVADLPSQKMRDMIGGSYRVKLAAMWEGPFEHYVWIDSDAIVWGDITRQVRTDLDFQIFWPEISIAADADEVPFWLPHFYFDLDRLRKFDPNFEWRGHPYFSAGVYACRRNVISYDQWLATEQWAKQEPGLFQFGDQGILNYLVHAKSQRGEIKTACSDLQWSRSFERRSIEKDCDQAGWHFPRQVGKPMVLHFCGSKPFTINFKAYSRPFTIARLAHHRRRHRLLSAWIHILLEDVCVFLRKLKGHFSHSMA